MVLKNFLIGPQVEGQQNNIEPFYLPEEAYFELEDVYVWRGRIRKRFGYQLIGSNDLNSRLRINLGNTDGSGDISTTVPGSIFKIGQTFSIGTEIFTVNALGTPATLLDTGSATLATYNTTTGALVINGAAINTACFFYPAEPVMGLRIRENSDINQEDLIAFDTQFAYERSGSGFDRLGTASWSGDNADFFWSSNYRGTNPYETFFYVVNDVAADNIKYIPESSSTWTSLRPQLNSGGTNRYLETCKMILPFKDRLIALNTVEDEGGTDRNYPNRCRFSQNGDPTNATTSWLDDISGRGGFIDAPTQEQIISSEYIKDRLIVYFERSTWELVYTGNFALPFRWQQINNELGCESTFSTVGFDKAVLGVGNVGVHACNGVNVERIDEKIPDEVFKIHNGNDGPARVYGIRDYFNEVVYWTYPDDTNDPTFPTRIFLYNYKNNTWAFFNDSFTCFGYFQKTSDLTWATVGDIYPTWSTWNDPWGSPLFQSSFPDIVAGTQQGFVVILDNGLSANSQSLYITDMNAANSRITIIDHNLKENDYVLVEDAQGITSLNDTIFQIQEVVDEDTIILDTTFTGTYSGDGKLTRISNLKILTKQFNPGTIVGQQFRVPYLDFLLNRTANGEVSVNYLIDTSSGDSIQDQVTSDALLGSNILYTKVEENQTFQVNQQKIWHRYYVQSQAQFLQLLLFMSDTQMRDKGIAQSDFEMHAIIFYAEPQGRLIG
jgi:hypothetical protein